MKVIEAIDVLVNEMANTESAPNYKGWIVKDENTGNEFVVTVQLKEGETPSEQLAAAKAEIAEYRESIVCLIIEHGIHDSYDGGVLPDNAQPEAIQVAIKTLAKHKGE